MKDHLRANEVRFPIHPARAARAPRTAGFSLIELLIAVAIIGILAGVGYPAYGEYVRETRRADAHVSLLSSAQAMERCRATSYSYAAPCNVPTNSPEGYYTLALTTQSPTTFTITATPIGAQANDSDCPTITLDHLGNRGPLASGGGASECWQ